MFNLTDYYCRRFGGFNFYLDSGACGAIGEYFAASRIIIIVKMMQTELEKQMEPKWSALEEPNQKPGHFASCAEAQMDIPIFV